MFFQVSMREAGGSRCTTMTSCSREQDHLLMRCSLRKRYEIREELLGAGPKDASEIIMLNRRVQWTETYQTLDM